MTIQKKIEALGAALTALIAAVATEALERVGASEPADGEEEKPKTKAPPKPAPKAKAAPVEEEEEEEDDAEEDDAEDNAEEEDDAEEEASEPENCTEAVAALIEADKRDEAIAILKKFGAKAVGDIPKDKKDKALKMLLAELAK